MNTRRVGPVEPLAEPSAPRNTPHHLSAPHRTPSKGRCGCGLPQFRTSSAPWFGKCGKASDDPLTDDNHGLSATIPRDMLTLDFERSIFSPRPQHGFQPLLFGGRFRSEVERLGDGVAGPVGGLDVFGPLACGYLVLNLA